MVPSSKINGDNPRAARAEGSIFALRAARSAVRGRQSALARIAAFAFSAAVHVRGRALRAWASPRSRRRPGAGPSRLLKYQENKNV
jgi:hypothetical protein